MNECVVLPRHTLILHPKENAKHHAKKKTHSQAKALGHKGNVCSNRMKLNQDVNLLPCGWAQRLLCKMTSET